jgi:protein gp37
LTCTDGRWNGTVRINVDDFSIPIRTRKPTTWAIWNDLFHEDVPFVAIDEVMLIILQLKWHTFIALTKRPTRMKEYFDSRRDPITGNLKIKFAGATVTGNDIIPNLWLGVTAENQQTADERIPLLLQTPATVRFVSVEPMLGRVDLGQASGLPVFKYAAQVKVNDGLSGNTIGEFKGGYWTKHDGNTQPWIDWVICGGESGPGARPMHPDWVRSLRDQCQAAGAPFFFKGWGEFVDEDQSPDDAVIPSKALYLNDGSFYGHPVYRLGKSKSGRLLDGRTWDGFPEVRS